VITLDENSDLALTKKKNESSVDTEDFGNEKAQTVARKEIREWTCQSYLDRTLVLGVFQNNP